MKSQEDEAAEEGAEGEAGEAGEEAKVPAEGSKEEAKEEVKEEKKAEEGEYKEEILGVSLEDYLGTRPGQRGKAAARAPEQIKEKVAGLTAEKQKQSTVLASQYMKTAVHAQKGADDQLMNFASVPDEDDGAPRAATGRGKRRGNQGGGPGQGQRRQNQPKGNKQTLKKTEEDYPTL